MKKTFFIFYCSIILSFAPIGAFAQSTPPFIHAETAILIDANTGEILFEKDSTKRMYPASITKLMTVLLALENMGSLNDRITFSREAIYSIGAGSAHIAIQEGEILSLEQCIYGILLRSANEVSNALAEHIDDSAEAFAAHMTQRAAQLGCEDTNFVNASGLFHENHYTTAYDMALIARELFNHSDYLQFLGQTYYEIPATNIQTEPRYLHNQHQMLNAPSLYYYEDAIGGKTGYTNESLNTLVTYASRDGMDLIAVVMKCSGAEHYTDSAALFDYGFENYKTIKLFSANDYVHTVNVIETYKDKVHNLGTVTAVPEADAYATLPKTASANDLQIRVNMPENIMTPVIAGQELGTIEVLSEGDVIYETPILSQGNMAETPLENYVQQEKAERAAWIKTIVKIPLITLFVLSVLFCVTRTVGYMQRKKRRKQRQKRMSRQRQMRR